MSENVQNWNVCSIRNPTHAWHYLTASYRQVFRVQKIELCQLVAFSKIVCTLKVDSYLPTASTRVCARIRPSTRACAALFILLAYIFTCAYARICAYVWPRVQGSWTFKTGVGTASNQMSLRGSRSTNGYRCHGNLHAHTHVRSYS